MSLRWFLSGWLVWMGSVVTWAAEPGVMVDLAGAEVGHSDQATDLERFAARELARYFRLLTGKEHRVRSSAERTVAPDRRQGGEVVVGTATSLKSLAGLLPEGLGSEGYVLRVLSTRPVRLWVGGREPAGVQRGAYALLERLGVGFYLGGDALPEPRSTLWVPSDLQEAKSPVFRIRGSLPWYNFLNSPTTWDLEDFQVFFDQMAKMGNNFVGFHSYDSEPFAAYPWAGEWRMGAPAATSLDYGWGTVRGLKSDAFGFGTGRYFPYEVFGSRSSALAAAPPSEGQRMAGVPRRTVNDEAILRAQAGLAQGLEYARRRGIHGCMGFELTGDPTDVEGRRQTEARIRNLLVTYPMVDYVWFWQSEGLGGGSAGMAPETPLDAMVQRMRPQFAYLGSPERIAEAARVAAWVQFAHGVVRRLRPELKVIVSGWGGDAWMRFSDFYVGLDHVLPKDVIFAALDNIDPTAQAHVSEAYGKLSSGREKWPIPWFESDGGGTRRDQWLGQANVKPFTHLVRDARAKGCAGLLGIHWQTRGIEEVAAYAAQYAWNPDLGYEDFYTEFGRKCFGEKQGPTMAAILMRLESLGPRWTGGAGQVECGEFQWFSDERRPRAENRAALTEIDATLARLEAEFGRGESRRHLERVRYLRASVAFALDFDRAALDLAPGGAVARQVESAEKAQEAGRGEEARRQAGEALTALGASSLGTAMARYVDRLTSQGDFGNLATINVKAYAAWLRLWERAQRVLGETRPLPGPIPWRSGPELVVKQPPTALPAGAPFLVRAVAFGEGPLRAVTLRHRAPGGKWKAVKMNPAGRNLYEAAIPREAIGERGVEYYVTARDAGERRSYAPAGFPATVYSASALPFGGQPQSRGPSGPIVYGPWLHREWAMASWTAAEASSVPVALRCTVVSPVEYETCRWEAVVGGERREGSCAYHLGVLSVKGGGPGLGVASWQVEDARGGRSRGAAVEFRPLPPPAPPVGITLEAFESLCVRVRWTGAVGTEYEVHRSERPGFDPTTETRVARIPWAVWDDLGLMPGRRYEYAVVAVDELGGRSSVVRSTTWEVADTPLPSAPKSVQVRPGLGRLSFAWQAGDEPVYGHAVFAVEANGERRVSGEPPLRRTEFTLPVEAPAPKRYVVRALDRARRLGPPSEVVEAAPLPVPREPVFVADFEGTEARTGQAGKLAGGGKLDGGFLDVREGGWIAYPGEELLQAGAPLTVALRVNVDRIEGIPVLISFGHWAGPGWWLQLIGGRIRWYLPVQKILDAGVLPTGGWHHLAATYDGSVSRLFVDGTEVGRAEIGPVDPAPWPGELRVGMYSDVGASYQTLGRIDDVKIWRRSLSAEELRSESERKR